MTATRECCFIAIDSGATNTRALLCNRQGEVLKRCQGLGANPKDAGWDAALNILKDSFKELLGAEPEKLERACIAVAGIDDAKSPEVWSKKLNLPRQKLLIMNDIHAAHVGAFSGQDGIMVVAGTGSSLLGRKAGVSRLLGGWGQVLGDQGSAYAIGLAAIQEAVNDHDLGHKTELLKALHRCYSVKERKDILTAFYPSSKATVAKFAKDVLDLASLGNQSAQNIVKFQIQYFRPLLERFLDLGYPKQVSYTGGLFKHPYYLGSFTDLVAQTGLELHAPKLTALEAAAQIALGNLEAFT